jgi:hypothetical protein
MTVHDAKIAVIVQQLRMVLGALEDLQVAVDVIDVRTMQNARAVGIPVPEDEPDDDDDGDQEPPRQHGQEPDIALPPWVNGE